MHDGKMLILGRILFDLAIAAVSSLAVVSTIICIKGIIDRRNLRNLCNQNGIQEAIVTMIDKCQNRVTLKDLQSNKSVTYEGDGISDDIQQGTVI